MKNISRSIKRYRQAIVKLTLLGVAATAHPALRALDVAYTVEGCPGTISGHAGEVKTFDVFAALTTSGNGTGLGAEGWSIGVAAEGATIKAISVAGLQVSTIFDADGDPGTPPVDPSIFDLGTLDVGHTGNALATRPGDGKKGAYSYVVLSSSEEKRVLQPNGTVRLARITVEATIPTGSSAATATIGFIDGLKSPGQTVKNTTVFAGLNHDPSLSSCSVRLEPIPEVAFNFQDCPEPDQLPVPGHRGQPSLRAGPLAGQLVEPEPPRLQRRPRARHLRRGRVHPVPVPGR